MEARIRLALAVEISVLTVFDISTILEMSLTKREPVSAPGGAIYERDSRLGRALGERASASDLTPSWLGSRGDLDLPVGLRRLPVLKRFGLPVCILAAATIAVGADELRVSASGSTFIYPLLGAWMKEYHGVHPEVRFWYDPVGSGKGIRQTLAGLVDFGASDGPIGDAELTHAGVKVVQLPVTLGAVVPAYNLPGLTGEVRFSGTALAGIYLGKIRKWDDPELARANPRLRLPNHDIELVFRLDESGTTYVWTDYLSKVNPEWNKRVGKGTHVSFPSGLGANFNEGVVAEIKRQPYTLGYLQLTYAVQNHVSFGRVQNETWFCTA